MDKVRLNPGHILHYTHQKYLSFPHPYSVVTIHQLHIAGVGHSSISAAMLITDQNQKLSQSVVTQVTGEQVLTRAHEMYHVVVVCAVMRVAVNSTHTRIYKTRVEAAISANMSMGKLIYINWSSRCSYMKSNY